MKRIIQSSKMKPSTEKMQCPACGGCALKQKTVTFPFALPTGKAIDVAGVQVWECLDCHEMTPTHEGRMKLARCFDVFMRLPG